MSKRNEILAEALNCGAFQNDGAHGIPANLLVTFEVDELMLFVAKIEREATERAAKKERADGVIVVAYALPSPNGCFTEIRIEQARQMYGPSLWAIRLNGDVLNKQGEWEWEPMPSSRDDAFLARARFATSEEAIAAAIRAGGEHGKA